MENLGIRKIRSKKKPKDKVDGEDEIEGNKKRDLLFFLMFVTNQKKRRVAEK